MFFNQDVLSRRDSGFGLLWLAATLGAKSNFKKLPKRDVLGADIVQLCDLIAEPEEPLALRLSSNLMVGLARVYKIKHEIFLGDVTSCFTALKKAVQDFHAMSMAAESLQMGNPSVRPDAVTLTADPGMALGLNIDDFFADWDDLLNVREVDSEDEYGRPKKASKKQKQRASSLEHARADQHILDESLEHMLSASFDVSASIDHSGVGPSSSQMDVDGFGFGFPDDPLLGGDDLNLDGDIGDELARELGEGWGGPPSQPGPISAGGMDIPIADIDFNQGGDFTFTGLDMSDDFSSARKTDRASDGSKGKKRALDEADKENDMPPPPLPSAFRDLTPIGASPAPLEPDQAGDSQALIDDPSQALTANETQEKPTKKPKRVRLLLDKVTELSDDEMKTARAQYVEDQRALRREMDHKRIQKESERLIDEIMWGPPEGVQAPVLVDYWLENFRIHVEARSGALHLEARGTPPTKRRRIETPNDQRFEDQPGHPFEEPDAARVEPGDVEMNYGDAFDAYQYQDTGAFEVGPSGRISSDAPEQLRRLSRPASPLGGRFDSVLGAPGGSQGPSQGSQRSSLFPWDHAGAGPSSSAGGGSFAPIGGGSVSVGSREIRIRGSSISRDRRESSLGPSGVLSAGASPGPEFGRFGSHASVGGTFEFDLPAEGISLIETQESDQNVVSLEKNSYNFLEYARMQVQASAQPEDGVMFDAVVPKDTSNAHVAAAGFYHCLVLATKNLIRVTQPAPYGPLNIQIV